LSESGDLRESHAFKEYNLGRNAKIRPPWAIIISMGVLAAAFSFLLYYYGIAVLGNPYAMNFIIGLVGIPAGFVVAFKNKTFDIMISWKYSSLSAIIYTVAYFLIGIILTSIEGLGLSNLFGGIVQLLLSCLVIAGYSILFTFAVGALLGTMVHGYLDDRKK